VSSSLTRKGRRLGSKAETTVHRKQSWRSGRSQPSWHRAPD